MKTVLFITNLLFVTVTLILAIINGEEALLTYLIWGIFQITTGLIILAAKALKLNTFKEIIVYWLMVIVYFTLIVQFISNQSVKLLIIPMAIALFHCYMTFKLVKK